MSTSATSRTDAGVTAAVTAGADAGRARAGAGRAGAGAGLAGADGGVARALSLVFRVVVRTVRGLHWYLKEIMGENAYLHYLESYRRRHGADEGAMGAREFWKDLTDEQDRNPKARCC